MSFKLLTSPAKFSNAFKAACFVATIATIASSLATTVQAQEYPNRPVHLIVPSPPAGSADVVARILADKLGAMWNQAVIVENKPGAGSNIGADFVAKAPPDGYTLLVEPNNVQTVNQFLGGKMSFDPAKDLDPVTLLGTAPFVLVVGPSLKVTSVKDLVAAAKARPGAITYATAGNGSVHHLMGEMFRSMTQIQITHVPYKGGAPAVLDLVGGTVDMSFSAATAVMPHIRSGKLTALAVTGANRIKDLPNVPTMIEAGVPGYTADAWVGMVAPAKTPAAVVAKINRDVRAVLADPAIIDKLSAQGVDVATTTPADFGKRIDSERASWGKLIAEAGIKGE